MVIDLTPYQKNDIARIISENDDHYTYLLKRGKINSAEYEQKKRRNLEVLKVIDGKNPIHQEITIKAGM